MHPTVRLAVLISCAFAASCRESPLSGPSPISLFTSLTGASSSVLVGAGDIGECSTSGAAATASLLDRISGTVIALGDNAYFTGTIDEYARCYEPSWGRHRSRTRPVPGNHEYFSGAIGYFSYFGDRAGPASLGYYSFSAGSWRVLALNSEVPSGPGSAQALWLRNELSARAAPCTAAYWHRPLFSSGRHGDNADLRDLWRLLYEFDVDLVINGHDHTYERFAPQDPDGRFDPDRGIRQFIVGTGGAHLYSFPRVRPNSEVRAAVWGVAVFTLSSGTYQWQFVPVDGETFSDSGSGTCH